MKCMRGERAGLVCKEEQQGKKQGKKPSQSSKERVCQKSKNKDITSEKLCQITISQVKVRKKLAVEKEYHKTGASRKKNITSEPLKPNQ